MANAKNSKKRKRKPTEASPKTPTRRSARFTAAAISETAGLSDPDPPLWFPPSPTPVEPMDTTLADEDLQEILDDPEANSTDIYTAANSDSDDPTDAIIQPTSALKIKLPTSRKEGSSSVETITISKRPKANTGKHSATTEKNKGAAIELEDDEDDEEAETRKNKQRMGHDIQIGRQCYSNGCSLHRYSTALSSHGVTLRTPPKAPLFNAFFTQPTSSSSAPPPHVEALHTMGYGHSQWPPPPPPYYYPPYTYPTAPPPPPTTIPAPTSAPTQTLNRTSTASSHGTQSDESKYPLLADFFSTLLTRHPERPALATFADIFQQHDIFGLQEIIEFDEDRLRNDFGMSLGNARFVLGRVKAEKKQIDRLSRKK
ncbi:uncharacterized protein LACBIDRAFT_322505 [Laccaria bicolor S238N-H82]|uniref:Predicted protein n=1 Tax=Laccaria bicolor (strain S238N-H82 / ATCC MYA-4686) TaxID=486041 RepID=B0CWI8_LACBS|nr:uncharacterized protein LACBIDRAFT_322505 [Laccaria bicolor S238N-H82]EDR13516.1 predicted protein [Laccaria bicolor S238N-H82]|eukprot:XP_001876014.1 predicted protein [Laccaria bicolor S238N-H82]